MGISDWQTNTPRGPSTAQNPAAILVLYTLGPCLGIWKSSLTTGHSPPVEIRVRPGPRIAKLKPAFMVRGYGTVAVVMKRIRIDLRIE